jgi:hypothetical protein
MPKENHENPTYSTTCPRSDKDAGRPGDDPSVTRQPHNGRRWVGRVFNDAARTYLDVEAQSMFGVLCRKM